MNPLPSIARLKELLDYHPQSGKLFWKRGRGGSARAGSEALATPLPRGYKRGLIDGVHYYAHRVIWKLENGQEPLGDIDHINGRRDDNRIQNLRLCERGENQKNFQTKPANGHYGIVPRCGKFGATIGAPPNRKWLGTFATLEEAVAARKEAEAKYGFHPNHGRTKHD